MVENMNSLFLLLRTGALLLVSAALLINNPNAEAADTPHFELRIYDVTAGKLDAVLARFREPIGRLRAKHGIETLGCWTALTKEGGEQFAYLLAGPDKAAFRAAEKAFGADPEFKAAYAAALQLHGKTVDKITSLPLATVEWSRLWLAEAKQPARAFELRVYDVAPGSLATLAASYRDARLKLFAKHGFTTLGCWTSGGTEGAAKFVLLLAHDSADAITAGKAAYHADPEWKQLVDAPAAGQPPLTTAVQSFILRPTDFSPLQ